MRSGWGKSICRNGGGGNDLREQADESDCLPGRSESQHGRKTPPKSDLQSMLIGQLNCQRWYTKRDSGQ